VAARGLGRRARLALFVSSLVFVAGVVASLLPQRPAEKGPPTLQRLTFRRGIVRSARFGPDGKSVIYSASWDGAAARLFLARAESPEAVALDLPDADLLSVSKRGDLAVLLKTPPLEAALGRFATLARVPIGGGTPRELLDQVQAADWGPDGESLAVVRMVGTRTRRLEYPIGHVLVETAPAGCIGSPRVAPDGNAVAFIACKDEPGPSIVVVDRAGRTRTLVRSLGWIGALAWAPSGQEIWYSSAARGGSQELRAVTLAGVSRSLAQLPGTIEDVSEGGELLLTRGSSLWGIRGKAPGGKEERELTWLQGSVAVDLSADGRLLLFGEALEGGSVNGKVFVRATDGAPALRVGEGAPGCLSPDGRWALVRRPGLTDFTILPTGTGAARELPVPGIHPYHARFFPDGRRLLLGAELSGRPGRLYVQGLDGGQPQPVTPERTGAGVVSPDGKWIATIGDDGHFFYPVDGGERRPFRGPEPGEWPLQWGADDSIYVARQAALPVRIVKVNAATGRREPWREIMPEDRAGIVQVVPILARNARAYVYTYQRDLSDLYLVGNVR
jgi:Tol biopolymer transport system component